MLFFSRKDDNKLWREITIEVKGGHIFKNFLIFLLFLTSLYLNGFYHFFGLPVYIFIPAASLFLVTFMTFNDIYLYFKALCKRIEKQQETIDLLMQKTGLSKPSATIKVEKKEELVESLRKYLSVEDAATRCFITELLGELGGPSANEALQNLLFDTDDKVRAAAQKSLEKLVVKA